jgi:hypothetical protein
MKKRNIQLVFQEDDSLWFASYSTFESLPFVRDKRKNYTGGTSARTSVMLHC